MFAGGLEEGTRHVLFAYDDPFQTAQTLLVQKQIDKEADSDRKEALGEALKTVQKELEKSGKK